MQLHQLKGDKHKKTGRRIGRGGKRGTTSGRGQKGQKSRAGRRIRPAQRDLILKIPRRRGFANKPKSAKPTIFNLSDLSLHLKISTGLRPPLVLDRDFLKQIGFLPNGFRGEVKILGDGDVKTPVVVRGLKISKGAKEKIEKAGGTIADQRGLNADNRRKLPRKSA
jgi:large subunit ribosomal protein L15